MPAHLYKVMFGEVPEDPFYTLSDGESMSVHPRDANGNEHDPALIHCQPDGQSTHVLLMDDDDVLKFVKGMLDPERELSRKKLVAYIIDGGCHVHGSKKSDQRNAMTAYLVCHYVEPPSDEQPKSN